MTVFPYIAFNGNAEEAVNFYAKVLKAQLILRRYSEMPGGPAPAEEDKNRIINSQIIGDGFVFMASDYPASMAGQYKGGSDITLSITADSVAEAKRIFDELAAGGQVIMPFAAVPWAEGYGMFTDKFNVNWQVNSPLIPM